MPAGYLIGRPFLPVSLARVVRILSQVDIEVLGIGGIFSAQDALQYLLCGCSACGLATAAYIKGIGVFQKVLDQLSEWMQKKNYRCILDFKGKVLRQMRPAPEVLAGETAPYAQPPHTPYLPRIDPEKCRFCLTCCQSCLYQALEADHEAKVIKVRADRCWSCGFCVGICPHGAIELVSRRSGETVWMGRGLASPFQ
jgi:ferredoxin